MQKGADYGYSIPVSDNGFNSTNWNNARGASGAEVVVVASKYLKDNGSSISNDQIMYVDHTVEDDDPVNGYRTAFSPWIPWSGTENVIRIHFTSLGNGLGAQTYDHSFLIAP
jgi:hypothetical protein